MNMGSLVRVENLVKWFRKGRSRVHAVNGVSFELQRGEAVALVGESGCGKTTTARCLMRLTEPTDGRIYFEDVDITALSERELRRFRRRMQMVFQDPVPSLNPRFTVRRTIGEPLMLHGRAKGPELEERIRELIHLVHLEEEHLDRYPLQLSGGQNQRVAIARAIATSPEFVVLDEPTSSLDMSIRIHMIKLLLDLKDRLNMAYLLITHDLSSARHLCSRVMVMYVGMIVESGPVTEMFSNPVHPYTKGLLSAVPIPDPRVERSQIMLSGETPSLSELPKGCALKDRCPRVEAQCREERPTLKAIGGEHYVACFLADGADLAAVVAFGR